MAAAGIAVGAGALVLGCGVLGTRLLRSGMWHEPPELEDGAWPQVAVAYRCCRGSYIEDCQMRIAECAKVAAQLGDLASKKIAVVYYDNPYEAGVKNCRFCVCVCLNVSSAGALNDEMRSLLTEDSWAFSTLPQATTVAALHFPRRLGAASVWPSQVKVWPALRKMMKKMRDEKKGSRAAAGPIVELHDPEAGRMQHHIVVDKGESFVLDGITHSDATPFDHEAAWPLGPANVAVRT